MSTELPFLPEPRLKGSFTAPIDLPAAFFECSSEAVKITQRGVERRIDLSQHFATVLSRGSQPHSLFLELRQRQDGSWQRIGLRTRARTLGPLDRLPSLELQAPNMAESDFVTVLAFVRGAMQLLGRESWGIPHDAAPLVSGPLLAIGDGKLPENMNFWIQGGALFLQYPWAKTRRRGPMIAFYSLLGIVLVSLAIALAQSPVFSVLAVLFFVGFGVYGLVAIAQNATTVSVDDKTLKIEHGPLPWFPTRPLDVGRIEQIFCREDRIEGREVAEVFRTYSVFALAGNSQRTIAKGLSEPEQAFFIESQIERFLAIADVPVVGELPRDAYPRQS